MTSAHPSALRSSAVGWYGKLPERGDFTGQGLSVDWVRTWDEWLQRALAPAAQLIGPALLRERLLAMAPWQCLLQRPPQGDFDTACALVVASQDRVGRVFPLIVVEALEPGDVERLTPARLHRRARGLAQWLLPACADGVATVESGLQRWLATPWAGAADVAPSGPWWPPAGQASAEGEALFSAATKGRSRWWRRLEPDEGFQPLEQPWPPRESLLMEWLAVPD